MDINPKISWYTNSEISLEHKHLSYKQVYCWILSEDNKLVLVSKDNKHWQFPGGHPEKNETVLETCYREVNEETGLNLTSLDISPTFFGYYVVEEFDPTINDIDTYLQLRLFAKLDKNSKELNIYPNEKVNEERKVYYTKWFSFKELSESISWIKDSNEFNTFKKIVNL